MWSPYQKLVMTPLYIGSPTNRVQFGYSISVNGSACFQHMLNLGDDFLAAHPDLFDREIARCSHYNLPFAFRKAPRRVLVVGAGTGNNAAAALRYGAEQVDCVEIDPAIYALGKELHPEHPYDSSRVRVIVNDARAFFQQAGGPYDLIWFGVLDAHALGSSYNNLRLDNYVYTRESLRAARRCWRATAVVLTESPQSWVSDRCLLSCCRRSDTTRLPCTTMTA